MDGEEMYGAMLAALTDHAQKQEEDAPRVITGMMPIAPFDAVTIDEEPVHVVGIVSYADDDPDFIAYKVLADGEMLPVIEGSVWPVKRDDTTNPAPAGT